DPRNGGRVVRLVAPWRTRDETAPSCRSAEGAALLMEDMIAPRRGDVSLIQRSRRSRRSASPRLLFAPIAPVASRSISRPHGDPMRHLLVAGAVLSLAGLCSAAEGLTFEKARELALPGAAGFDLLSTDA